MFELTPAGKHARALEQRSVAVCPSALIDALSPSTTAASITDIDRCRAELAQEEAR